MIIDFFAHGKIEGQTPARHTVAHHGFTEEQMRDLFVKAGAGGDFGMSDMGDMTLTRVMGEDTVPTEVRRRLFIARGTKG